MITGGFPSLLCNVIKGPAISLTGWYIYAYDGPASLPRDKSGPNDIRSERAILILFMESFGTVEMLL